MTTFFVAWGVLLSLVTVGMIMQFAGTTKRRRRCRHRCDPKHFVILWDDGHSRKVRCVVCGWTHHAEKAVCE